MLEGRSKAASRDLNAQTNVLNVKLEDLRLENLRLREDLEAAGHDKLMEGQQGLETLKLRNKFLQVCVFFNYNRGPSSRLCK
jgi:hypothetical protein